MENKITKYETIHLNYINGNKKQMVEQMDDIDIPDFLEWLNEVTTDDKAMALIISYFHNISLKDKIMSDLEKLEVKLKNYRIKCLLTGKESPVPSNYDFTVNGQNGVIYNPTINALIRAIDDLSSENGPKLGHMKIKEY